MRHRILSFMSAKTSWPSATALLALAGLGGVSCTLLLDTTSLVTSCELPTDCPTGFYCDQGTCLPGKPDAGFLPDGGPLVIVPSSDGGTQPPPQDGGTSPVPTPDAGEVSAETDAGAELDGGQTPEPTDVDAGASAPEDAGQGEDTENDAGDLPATDSGPSSDAGA